MVSETPCEAAESSMLLIHESRVYTALRSLQHQDVVTSPPRPILTFEEQPYLRATSGAAGSVASPVGAAGIGAETVWGALRKNASKAPTSSMIPHMIKA